MTSNEHRLSSQKGNHEEHQTNYERFQLQKWSIHHSKFQKSLEEDDGLRTTAQSNRIQDGDTGYRTGGNTGWGDSTCLLALANEQKDKNEKSSESRPLRSFRKDFWKGSGRPWNREEFSWYQREQRNSVLRKHSEWLNSVQLVFFFGCGVFSAILVVCSFHGILIPLVDH